MNDDSRSRTPNLPATSRRALLLGSAGLALGGAILPGSKPAAAAEPKRGGTMRIACPPATNLDPVKMQSAGAIAIVQQAAEYLVWADPDLKLRPVLATSWKTDDAGKTWVFDIRQGVKFHDGRDLTAADVVATFKRLVDPKTGSAGGAQLAFLKQDGIKQVGDHQVEFALERAIGQFPYYTAIYNAVILPADYAGDFATKPVGTGPFKVTSYKPQQGASLERNEDYWDKGKPYLDKVEIALFENQQAQTLALQGGQVDLILDSPYSDARPFFQNPDIVVEAVPTAEHRELCMRCDKKPFTDKRVRQAVALVVQRQKIIKGLFGDEAQLGNDHVVAPIFPEHVEIAQREADVARAKQLLADAGYPDGFPIDLYSEQYQELPQYAQVLAQMLAGVGIKVTLKIEPQNVYYDHWTEVTFGLTDWTSRPTAAQMLSVAFKSGAEWNQAHWSNAEFDHTVDAMEAEVDDKKRAALAQKAAMLMHDEVPAVIAYFKKGLRPKRKNVAGVPGSISQFLDLTRAHFV